MKQILNKLITPLGVILAFVLGASLLYWINKKPTRSGTLTLPKLERPVEVLFDQWGIPHIYGQSEGDAVHALGYLQAQDRLFQIDLLRRIGSGQLAEIFGETAVKTDRFFRTIGIKHFAKKYLEKTREDLHAPLLPLLRQYIAGVNEFIKHGATPIEYDILQIEPQPLVEEDIGHLLGYMAFSFAHSLKSDPIASYVFNHLGRDYAQDLLPTSIDRTTPQILIPTPKLNNLAAFVSQLDSLLPGGLFYGSNAWVISGKKTSNGLPILANDPHIGFSLPDVWYEAHIHTPTYESYGHHLAGSPLPAIGFNHRFAWGVTMFENDDMDFYRERLNPTNANETLHKGKWVPLEIRDEVINIKDQAPRTFQVKSTPHGPIMNNVLEFYSATTKTPIAMYWTFTSPQNTSLESFYEMTHATSFEEFATGVSLLWSPGLNILYADTNNTIAQWGAGRIPIRPPHVNPLLILDGASGADDILGYHPFEANPSIINPENGVLISANDRYKDHNDPYVYGYYVPKERSERLAKLLRTPENQWTVDKVKAVQLDVQKAYPKKVLPILLPIIEKPGNEFRYSKIATSAAKVLEVWDGTYNKTAIGPTVWERFYYFCIQDLYGDDLPKNLFSALLRTNLVEDSFLKIVKNPQSPWWRESQSKGGDQRKIIRHAWKKAIASLVKQFGNELSQWTWGKIHTLEFQHPFYRKTRLARILNVGPFQMDGTKNTVNSLGHSPKETDARVTTGPSTRRIIPLGNLHAATAVSPLGQSGNPLDPHYNDQTPLFLKGKYRAQYLYREDIEANLSSTLRFVPQSR